MIIDKGAAKRIRDAAKHGVEQRLLLFCRLIDQRCRLARSLNDKLRPDFDDLLRKLRGRKIHALGIAEHLNIFKEGVGGGQRILRMPICLLKTVIAGMKIGDFISGPFLSRVFAEHGVKALIASLMREVNEVDFAVGIELQELLIDAITHGILRFRQHAGDIGLDAYCVQRAHDADTLVALDNIKSIVVFVSDDRIAQAICDHVVIEGIPFVGEFGSGIQQRQKIARKCRRAAARSGSFNIFKWNLNQSERHLREAIELGNDLTEHRQRGILAPALQGMRQLLCFFLRMQIVINGHIQHSFPG